MPLPSLFTSAVALTNLQKAVDTVANNIANVNTTAFKSSRIYFNQEASNIITPAGSPAGNFAGSNPIEIGTGMKVGDVSTAFTRGPLKNTGTATDLAISGLGSAFFVVSSQTPNDAAGLTAPKFTRDGHFMIDSDENLANSSGDKVMGAMLYDNQSGRIKTLSGYSAVTYFADQEIGDIQPTTGSPNLAIPNPTISGTAGSTTPVFNASKLAELSVRGNVINSGVKVDVAVKGDLTISKDSQNRMVFKFVDANSADPDKTYTATLDTTQTIADNVVTLDMTSANKNQVQLRIRVEPGVQSLEEVFSLIDYDKDATPPASDTMVFTATDPATQSSSNITVGDADLKYITLAELKSLMSPVKIPNFFYTQDPNLELETSKYKIEPDGSMSVEGSKGEKIMLGRLLIANFINPDGLINIGDNKYDESSNSGQAAISVVGGPFDKSAPSISAVKIVSGALEQSNVNLANEFAELIGFQRSLQATSRVITTSDEILQTLINL